MKKEMISMRQIIFLVILFIFGDSAIIGLNAETGQDAWISLLMATVFVLPLVLMYARIMKLYPEENIFYIMQEVFKPFIGKILIILFVWYALHVSITILSIFCNFIKMTSLTATPKVVIIAAMVLTVIYVVLSSMHNMGRGVVSAFSILCISLILTIFLSFGRVQNFENLFPIANHSIKELSAGAWRILVFPLAETVLFLGVADDIRQGKNDNPYKLYLYSILFGSLVLMVIVLRNIILLGPDLMENSYFPSFKAARLIGIQNFLERIEGLITYAFIIAGVAKLAICLFTAAKGITKLFGLKNYKVVVAPLSLLIFAMCPIANASIVEVFEFLKPYQIYAIPFQIIIPFIVWIGAEISVRKKRKEGIALPADNQIAVE
jgi:spore germination protein KB